MQKAELCVRSDGQHGPPAQPQSAASAEHDG